MEIKEIKTRLKDDISKLTDYRGFLNAGAPRFSLLFGRDSLISSWQLLDYDPEIAAVTLKTLSKLQAVKSDPERDADPGKILHEMWEGNQSEIEQLHIDHVPFPYYGSADSTPLFLIVAGKYFETTGDRNLIVSLWPNLMAAKNWILDFGDENKDGFLDFRRKNPHGPLNQCWKDGKESPHFDKHPIAAVEVQGYKYEALKKFNLLAGAVGDRERVAENYLENFKENFNKEFYWPEEKFYHLAIDDSRKKYPITASNPGHLLFTDLIDKNQKENIVKRLFAADMWTPYGIRTHSTLNKDFNENDYQLGAVWPFDNWIIAEGLRVSGFKKEYGIIRDALLSAYQKLGHIPELYSVSKEGEIKRIPQANPLQAWSSAGLFDLLSKD